MRSRCLEPLSAWLAFLLLGILNGGAHAAAVPSRASRGITIGPCTTRPGASCWRDAQPLVRFAPEVRVFADPIQTDVRLAHDGKRLLVRAMRLPQDAHLEVVVGPDERSGLAQTQVLIVKRGVHSLALAPKLQLGKQRAIRIHLRLKGEQTVRTWAPAGHGDMTRPAMALFTKKLPDTPRTVHILEQDGRLQVQAPGAAHVKVIHRRPTLPKGGKGIPKPWAESGSDAIDVSAPPFTGWYDLTATWLNDEGDITEQAIREFYLRAPGAPTGLADGFHPHPKTLVAIDDEPFVFQAGARACTDVLDWLAVVKLSQRELKRFTGIQPSGDCAEQTPGPLDIWWHQDASVPAEGFRIEVSATNGAHIYASDRNGALYGGIALVDALGPDAELPALTAEDAPAIGMRMVFHLVTVPGKARIDPDDYITFIERALTRGRINTLVLHMGAGYRYPSHPKLARPNAWKDKDIARVRKAASELGIQVIPGLTSPGHASWLTGRFPELKEDAIGAQLCTRHPQTRPLLIELMEDLIKVFGNPALMHIGHDEVWWRTKQKHEVQRCPRCEGTPRWLLLAEDIQWQHDWLMERNIRPILWTDMLVRGWHGGNGSAYRASNRLPEAERSDYLMMSWTRRGDSIKALGSKGYPIIRGHTGYTDWKRQGLSERVDELVGEGLAVFYATPWSTFGGQTGPINLYHLWPNAILTGTTAWRPELADVPIAESLDHLTQTSTYTPGYAHLSGEASPLTLEGQATRVDAALPESAEINRVQFDLGQPMRADEDDSITAAAVGKVRSISWLQATEFTREAAQRFLKAHRRMDDLDGPPVAKMHVSWADGEQSTVSLRLGSDTERPDRRVRGQMLWRTAGSLRVPSSDTASLNKDATDRAFFRWDWTNPRPDQAIESIRWDVDEPGVRWLLLGATALR